MFTNLLTPLPYQCVCSAVNNIRNTDEPPVSQPTSQPHQAHSLQNPLCPSSPSSALWHLLCCISLVKSIDNADSSSSTLRAAFVHVCCMYVNTRGVCVILLKFRYIACSIIYIRYVILDISLIGNRTVKEILLHLSSVDNCSAISVID